MRFRWGLQALFVVLLGCAAPLGAADESAVRDFIRQAEERFAAAQVRRDVPAMMEFYANDAVVFPPGEGPVSGKAAIARWRTRSLAAAPRLAREQFEMASLDVCGDLAVETGSVSVQEDASGASSVTSRTPYITIWKRQEDGSWKIQKDIWNHGPGAGGIDSAGTMPPAPGSASTLPAPPAATVSQPPPMPASPPDFIPIPDPRPLSDGYVRNIGDQLRARVGKIRALEASHAGEAAREAAIRRADRELQALIRDVGWIDVGRFGVATACNAAFIVEKSGDPALIKAAVPQMKDLQSNEESVACYRRALEAYEKLPK
jgi:ketosteroid isomerase-like protein